MSVHNINDDDRTQLTHFIVFLVLHLLILAYLHFKKTFSRENFII